MVGSGLANENIVFRWRCRSKTPMRTHIKNKIIKNEGENYYVKPKC
jgi:hypothetical protein